MGVCFVWFFSSDANEQVIGKKDQHKQPLGTVPAS